MKRIIVLLMGFMLLAGCGAASLKGTAETTTGIAATDEWAALMEWFDRTHPASIAAATDSLGGERFPLYASVPEDEIYLYGIVGENFRRDVVLFQEDCETYFSGWGGDAWRGYTEMIYHDFDGDGKKEIGVVAYQGSGTGVYLSDLHIVSVEKIETGGWDANKNCPTYKYKHIDHALTHEDVTAFFSQGLESKRGKQENTVEFSFGKKTWTANLEPDVTWDENEEVHVGTHIRFWFEGNEIKLSAIPYVNYIEYLMPGWLCGDFTADVTFDGREFHITNIDFEPDQER